ncbi:MAG: protoporphyrinogen oxidase [Terriglobia bacterium]
MADPPQSVCRVAIVGAGISGLAAAYRLAQARHAGAPVAAFVLDDAARPGGLIQTERVQDFLIEGGPDSFLTEKTEAPSLATELGLGAELIGSNDAARRTYVLHRGGLAPLPDAFSLFVPRRLSKVVFSPLVPLASKLAALRERFLRPPGAAEPRSDEPVSWFVERHFGRGMLDNIAEPLLAAIYGADVERLSVQAALPSFYALERVYGSLTRGVLMNREEHPDRPLFTTLRGGMQNLVDALAGALAEPGENREPRLLSGRRAARLERRQSGGAKYVLACQSGEMFEADAVICALPAPEAATLVQAVSSALAERLEQIRYTPAVTVSLAYSALSLPSGFGFVVPAKENRRLLACTFVQSKFPARVPPGRALLRCFLGGARDPSVIQMQDQDLISAVKRELRAGLGIDSDPDFFRIYRWPVAMPQYDVGHRDLVREIAEAVGKLPGFFLAGNAYSGVGISDCIRTANTAAERAVEYARARAQIV